MDDMRIEPYTPELSQACIELERACHQGRSYRLSFKRSVFHRRAESYASWEILVARKDGRVVGTIARAMKTVRLHDRPCRAAFFFDIRVHPDLRRRGIGKRFGTEILARSQAEGATVSYVYFVHDNRATARLSLLKGGKMVGGYRYLIWPVYRERKVTSEPSAVSAVRVHQAMLQASDPFDFYCNPLEEGKLQGHVASYLGERAGCSIWSNAGLLEEVVEAIPPFYRAARRLFNAWPLRRARWPHIPSPGEALNSWFIFDFFARDAESARDLMRFVNNLALEHGIDFCYIITVSGDRWYEWLRSDTVGLFSPTINYSMMMRTPGLPCVPPERIYVDIRDL